MRDVPVSRLAIGKHHAGTISDFRWRHGTTLRHRLPAWRHSLITRWASQEQQCIPVHQYNDVTNCRRHSSLTYGGRFTEAFISAPRLLMFSLCTRLRTQGYFYWTKHLYLLNSMQFLKTWKPRKSSPNF